MFDGVCGLGCQTPLFGGLLAQVDAFGRFFIKLLGHRRRPAHAGQALTVTVRVADSRRMETVSPGLTSRGLTCAPLTSTRPLTISSLASVRVL